MTAARVIAAMEAARDAGATPAEVLAAGRAAAARLAAAAAAAPAPTPTAYRAGDGATLDEIAWRAYGAESAVHDILAATANAALARLGPALPAGALVALPEIESAPPAPQPAPLWS